MCKGSKPKVDNSAQVQAQQEAQEARAREEARQARIKAGTSTIEDAFGGFNDTFYQKRRNSFMGAYTPQINDQYGDARDQLLFALANAGLVNSSVAAERQAKLNSQRDLAFADVTSKAQADQTALAGQVQSQKSALISQLNATGDSEAATNLANAQSKIIAQDAPKVESLGALFTGTAEGIGNYQIGRERGALSQFAGGGTGRRQTSILVRG